MSLPTVLVTGANRGLGLEFVRQYLKASRPPAEIIATCRDPSKATDLQSLASTSPNVHVLKVEVKDYASFPSLVEQVSQIVGSSGLSVLINNAGMYNKVSLTDGAAAESIVEKIVENFEVNAVSPFMLVRAFLPLIEKAKGSVGSGVQPVIANITSKMGSVDDNTSGGHYAYRASKSGLNMISKSLQVDLEPKGIRVAAIHPGWVQTDMGGANAILTPELSVSNMVQTIERVSRSEIGNDGKIFLNFDGKVIPW